MKNKELVKQISINIYSLIFTIFICTVLIAKYYTFTIIKHAYSLNIHFPYSLSQLSIIKLTDFHFSTISLPQLCKTLGIHNLVFNFIYLLTKQPLFSINVTPAIILVLCFYFIYRLSSLNKDNFYGLMTVLLLSTFPITAKYAIYNVYHLGETFYLLCAVYFYLKSNHLNITSYSILYCLSLLFILFGGNGLRSGLMYTPIILSLNFYFLKYKSNHNIKQVFTYIGIIALFILLIFKYTIVCNEYIADKKLISCFNFGTTSYKNILLNFLDYFVYYLPICYTATVNSILILILLFLTPFFIKQKKTTEEIINLCLMVIPLLILIIAFNKVSIFDIFPAYVFMTLLCLDTLFSIDQKFSPTKANLILKNFKIISIAFLFIAGSLSLNTYPRNTSGQNDLSLFPQKKIPLFSKNNFSLFSQETIIFDKEQNILYEFILQQINNTQTTNQPSPFLICNLPQSTDTKTRSFIEQITERELFPLFYIHRISPKIVTHQTQNTAKKVNEIIVNYPQNKYYIFITDNLEEDFFKNKLTQFNTSNKNKKFISNKFLLSSHKKTQLQVYIVTKNNLP